MKKIYKAVIQSRSRINIPYDCWMDAKCHDGIRLNIKGDWYEWEDAVGLTPSAAYRVTVPLKEGEKYELRPDARRRMICLRKI